MRETERQRETHRQRVTETDRQTDGQTDKETDRKTDRQRERAGVAGVHARGLTGQHDNVSHIAPLVFNELRSSLYL